MSKYLRGSKTLEELENDYWQPLDDYLTQMVKEIYLLRKKRISDLDCNDIRLLLSQGIGLTFLVPNALSILENDILEEALYYPGDLLLAILEIKGEYWKQNPKDKTKVNSLITESLSLISTTPTISDEIRLSLLSKIDKFTDELDSTLG